MTLHQCLSDPESYPTMSPSSLPKPIRTYIHLDINNRSISYRAPSTASSSTPYLALHENIYTLPNFLTFTRLLAAPAVGYLLVHDQHIPALALFVYAGVTDLVDGWIARKWGSTTVVGTVIDPMADKALMTIVTVGLGWKGVLPCE